MRHARLAAAAVVAATLALAGGVGAVNAGTPVTGRAMVARDTTTEVTDAMIAAGRQVYHGTGLCMACHGPNLEGGVVAPNLKDATWKDGDGSYDDILKVVLGGVSGTAMQGHPGGITDAQARNVAAYVWAVSQGKAKP